MIDAQPGDDGWIVPLAVTAALFDDPEAAETAYRAVKPLAETAARCPRPRNPLWTTPPGTAWPTPSCARRPSTCFAAALEALPRLGAARRGHWTPSPRSPTAMSPGADAPPTTCSTARATASAPGRRPRT